MELMDVIRTRRSVRRYKSDPVAKEILWELVQAATLAPNGSNSQQWDFVFVTDPEKLDRVAEIIGMSHRQYFGSARTDSSAGERLDKIVTMYTNLRKAPVFVIFCINKRNVLLQPDYQKYIDLWAQHSIAAAIENFFLAAWNHGLGTVWMGTPSWRSEEIKKLLQIPDEVEIVAASPIGYPDETPKIRPRLPLEDVTHFDKW